MCVRLNTMTLGYVRDQMRTWHVFGANTEVFGANIYRYLGHIQFNLGEYSGEYSGIGGKYRSTWSKYSGILGILVDLGSIENISDVLR